MSGRRVRNRSRLITKPTQSTKNSWMAHTKIAITSVRMNIRGKSITEVSVNSFT